MAEAQTGFTFNGAWSDAHPDCVLTPEHIARQVVDYFPIEGRVLDPCRGPGVFYDLLPGADWCELQQGRDFFSESGPYDWIVGNPPYSIYAKWLRHSMELAENIVYVNYLGTFFRNGQLLRDTLTWGGIPTMLHLGAGKALGFPNDGAAGVIHYQRGYGGPITFTNGFPA